tara:strand:- start:712 stop:876 length:165 start_codon:yes stop_codon:yes gene_type:complete
VTLKIVQDKIIKKNNLLPKIKYYNKIEEKMKKVKDEKLKNSLSSLLKAYNEKYK